MAYLGRELAAQPHLGIGFANGVRVCVRTGQFVPQRLKPLGFGTACGTTEVVP